LIAFDTRSIAVNPGCCDVAMVDWEVDLRVDADDIPDP
jgi:hypothetical protein